MRRNDFSGGNLQRGKEGRCAVPRVIHGSVQGAPVRQLQVVFGLQRLLTMRGRTPTSAAIDRVLRPRPPATRSRPASRRAAASSGARQRARAEIPNLKLGPSTISNDL
jgi:hypothetical protein